MPHDGHDHGHDHEGMSPSGHPYRPDQDAPLSYFQKMEIAVRELLVEKNVASQAEINAQIARMDDRTPAIGARVVARWAHKLALYENWAQFLGANLSRRVWFRPIDRWLRRRI